MQIHKISSPSIEEESELQAQHTDETAEELKISKLHKICFKSDSMPTSYVIKPDSNDADKRVLMSTVELQAKFDNQQMATKFERKQSPLARTMKGRK